MTTQIKGYNKDPTRATIPGQRFFMDYGFAHNKETTKQEYGLLLTSKDGFNYYLLIENDYSHHLCVFLFADKKPSITTVIKFLRPRGVKSKLKWVRTDQGGGLDGSATFRSCILEADFTLDPTGDGSSF